MQGVADNSVLEAAYVTHVGMIRMVNQDFFSASIEEGLFALADGMGGHNAGEVASKLAVETVREELLRDSDVSGIDVTENLLRVGQAVEAANATVFESSHERQELKGMGTTIVVAMFRGSQVFFAHVGDSRLYRYRDGRLSCLTRDHSLIQEVVDHGIFHNKAEAREAGVGDNVLTRSLGLAEAVNVDVGETDVRPGDLYLLCSDGLSNYVDDKEISKLLAMRDESLQMRVDYLLEHSLEAGGRDNISLILVRVHS